MFGTNTKPGVNLQEMTVIRYDLNKSFNSLFQNFKEENRRFDIIFIDPPYDRGLSLKTLQQLDDTDSLVDDGLIIVEERSNVVLPKLFNNFELYDIRKYGDTSF